MFQILKNVLLSLVAKIKRQRHCSGKWLAVLGDWFSPWLFGLSLLLSLLLLSPFSHAQVSEPQLRAGVIVGVLRFTSWATPPSTNTSTVNAPAASTLLVCGVGGSPGFGVLERAGTKIAVSGKELVFKAIDNLNDNNGCTVLIVGAGGSGAKGVSSKQQPLLSICDGCDQPDRHAVVVFMNNQRVQFSVDMALAQSAGVQFSSNMLELAARVVHR